MCSFVFIKGAYTLPAASSVTWCTIGAVPLCEAVLAGTGRVPYSLRRAHRPRKAILCSHCHQPCPVTGLALPSSPALPSFLSLPLALFLPRALVPLSAPSSAASLSRMASIDEVGHFTSLQTMSGTSGLLLWMSQGAWPSGGPQCRPQRQ